MNRLSLVLLVVCGCSGATPDDGKPHDAGADAQKPTQDASPSDATDATPAADAIVDASTDAADASTQADAEADDTGTGPDASVQPCLDNNDCANTTEYCERGTNNCSGSGQCEAIPKGCSKVYAPVCGCDGTDYNNDCEAHRMGHVSVAHAGMCP